MPCPYIGNYPEEYNRAVHGPYDPARYYGKPDTPFGQVKLSELGAWFKRRSFRPRAIAGAISRAMMRQNWKWMTPRYSGAIWFAQIAALFVVYSYFINYKTIRHEKNYKYHW